MNASAAVKALIVSRGIKQGDLKELLGVSSVQAVSNKFRLNRWTASELSAVAAHCGAKLCFVLADGERILIDPPAAPAPGAAPGKGTGGGIGGGADLAGVTPVSNPKKKMGHSKAK